MQINSSRIKIANVVPGSVIVDVAILDSSPTARTNDTTAVFDQNVRVWELGQYVTAVLAANTSALDFGYALEALKVTLFVDSSVLSNLTGAGNGSGYNNTSNSGYVEVLLLGNNSDFVSSGHTGNGQVSLFGDMGTTIGISVAIGGGTLLLLLITALVLLRCTRTKAVIPKPMSGIRAKGHASEFSRRQSGPNVIMVNPMLQPVETSDAVTLQHAGAQLFSKKLSKSALKPSVRHVGDEDVDVESGNGTGIHTLGLSSARPTQVSQRRYATPRHVRNVSSGDVVVGIANTVAKRNMK